MMLAQATELTKAAGDVVAGRDVATVLGGMLTIAFIVVAFLYRELRATQDRERAGLEVALRSYQSAAGKGKETP